MSWLILKQNTHLQQSGHLLVETEHAVHSACRSLSFCPSGVCSTFLETQKPVCWVYLWISISFLWKATKSQVRTAKVCVCPSVWSVSWLPSAPMSVCGEPSSSCRASREWACHCRAAGFQDCRWRSPCLRMEARHPSRAPLCFCKYVNIFLYFLAGEASNAVVFI